MKKEQRTIEERLEAIKNFYNKLDNVLGMLPDVIPDEMIERVKKAIFNDADLKRIMDGIESNRPPRFMLVGRTGVGKSSLINAICGLYVAKVSDVEIGTRGIEKYSCMDGDRVLMEVLDSREIGEPVALKKEDSESEETVLESAEEVLKEEMLNFMPDAILFVSRCKRDGIIKEDMDYVKNLRREYWKKVGVEVPVIVVLNQADAVATKLQEYSRIYPGKRYGGGFLKWAEQGDIRAVRKAKSNGGAMRATPIGWLYSSLPETLRVAKIATERTHNSREAIESAQMIAASVFLARRVKDKEVIRGYGEQKFGYTILRGRSGYEQLREESRRYRKERLRKLELKHLVNCGAKQSVEAALFAFLNTEDYEDCIRTAIAVGGDSDTIACMAGGIAEAFYGGVPVEWKYKAGGILAEWGCRPEDLDMVMNFGRYAAPITNDDFPF